MVWSATPRYMAWLVFAVAVITILSAWAFEYAGYAPCELCLMQRWAYYAGVPLAWLAALAAPPALLRAALVVLALIFIGSCAFGIYHAGVEWGFWQGPTACTGSFKPSGDILADLKNTKVVRCDAVAIRILGLSLAGWNAVVSFGLAAMAVLGTRGRLAA